jgi:acetyl-CoA acetyltransferase
MAQHAAAAIQRGDAEVILLSYGSTARSDVKNRRRTGTTAVSNSGPLQFDAPYGHTLIAKYAMAARRHMIEYGTTIEQLAEIAVAARLHAENNPDAFRREPISVDDVQNSKMVADPLTQLHCCVRTDGGGAVILASEERARDCAQEPIWIMGAGQALSHVSMSQWPDFTESPCVRSGAAAFRQAGVTVDDIDVWEIYDSFTYTVLATLEGLGVCPPGEGGAFVGDGKLRPGGSFAMNTDGGGLSACHPGMRGMFLLVEAVNQLRGTAGNRQVADARLGLVNATGGFFSATGTMILGRD